MVESRPRYKVAARPNLGEGAAAAAHMQQQELRQPFLEVRRRTIGQALQL